MNFQILQNLLQNLRMECWNTFLQTKILMGSFQVNDAMSILFKPENPLVEHLEGFIFLLREGGEL